MRHGSFYLLLQSRANTSPDKPFLYLGGQFHSYADIAASVQSVRVRLPDIRKKVVLIHTGDWLDQLLYYFAIQGAGGVPVIAHFPADPRELQSYGIAGSLGDGLSVLKQAPPPNACFGVLSSGSTGAPKLYFRTYSSWADFYPVHNRIFFPAPDSRLLLHGSLSFTGNLNATMALLYGGGAVVTGTELSPRIWLGLIRQTGVTAVYLVPEKLHRLASAAKNAHPQVRTILAGSQLLGANIAGALRSGFPRAEVFLYYGTSECSFITYRRIGADGDLRNVGKPFPGIGLEARGDSLWVNTPYGIIGQPRPCPLPDQGDLLEDGSLLFLGRRGNTANLAGVQVNLTKIELRAQAVPGVATAAAVCYQGKGRRPRICLFYTGTIEAEKLHKRLSGVPFAPERPWRVLRLDAMPLSPAGKPALKCLQGLIAERQPRQSSQNR